MIQFLSPSPLKCAEEIREEHIKKFCDIYFDIFCNASLVVNEGNDKLSDLKYIYDVSWVSASERNYEWFSVMFVTLLQRGISKDICRDALEGMLLHVVSTRKRTSGFKIKTMTAPTPVIPPKYKGDTLFDSCKNMYEAVHCK